MLYNYKDIKGTPPEMNRPSEDVSIDGKWLTGWNESYLRVLYTSGRHGLSIQESDSGKIPGRDGGIVYARSLPTRKIIVGCEIKTKTSAEMATFFSSLRALCYRNMELREIIFADDPEYRYFGRIISISEPESGKNNSKFEITVSCPDPYRYGIEKTASIKEMLSDSAQKGIPYKLIRYTTTPSDATLIKNVTTAEKIALQSAENSEITVDFIEARIYRGDINITSRLAFEASQFPEFIICHGDSVSGTGKMTYRKRMM